MATQGTKLNKLVHFLKIAAGNGRLLSRGAIKRRFRGDPSFVVYFNGMRRNGAVNTQGKVLISKIPAALRGFRKGNKKIQLAYSKRQVTIQPVVGNRITQL